MIYRINLKSIFKWNLVKLFICLIYRINLKSIFKWNLVKLFICLIYRINLKSIFKWNLVKLFICLIYRINLKSIFKWNLVTLFICLIYRINLKSIFKWNLVTLFICLIYRINLKSIFKWNLVKLFIHLAPTKLFQRIEQMIFLKREKKRTQGRGCEWYIYNQSEIHLLLKFSKVLSIYNYLCSQPIQSAMLYVKCQKDLLIIMNVMGKQDSVRFQLRTDFRPMAYIDALYCFPVGGWFMAKVEPINVLVVISWHMIYTLTHPPLEKGNENLDQYFSG